MTKNSISKEIRISCPLVSLCRKRQEYIDTVKYITDNWRKSIGRKYCMWDLVKDCPHKIADGLQEDFAHEGPWLHYFECAIYKKWLAKQNKEVKGCR